MYKLSNQKYILTTFNKKKEKETVVNSIAIWAFFRVTGIL